MTDQQREDLIEMLRKESPVDGDSLANIIIFLDKFFDAGYCFSANPSANPDFHVVLKKNMQELCDLLAKYGFDFIEEDPLQAIRISFQKLLSGGNRNRNTK